MAVKASAHVTLSVVAEIQACYRYYLLQASTLTAPSKPTTYPPTGSWVDSEPTYVDGSTNTLYFVDLNLYSDNTWSYSAVSKSSSYEAAKQAYNKAVAAGNAAQNAQDDVDATKEALDNTNAALSDAVTDIRGSMDELGAEVSNNATIVAEHTEKIATITNEQGVIQDNFLTVTETIKDVDGKIEAEIKERISYIRRDDTGMLLGDDQPDAMQLHLSNKQITFKEQGAPVAWISGKKLYITEAEVTNTLKIGNFEFEVHGANKNLGLRRVTS